MKNLKSLIESGKTSAEIIDSLTESDHFSKMMKEMEDIDSKKDMDKKMKEMIKEMKDDEDMADAADKMKEKYEDLKDSYDSDEMSEAEYCDKMREMYMKSKKK